MSDYGICSDCEYYRDTDSTCWFIPPATVAKALGVEHQYELTEANTHPDWSCSMWSGSDE